MKIKSYHILFKLFSFLSDRTNGASLFVKYKLILGSLILGITSSSAQNTPKLKTQKEILPTIPEQSMITCYDISIVDLITMNISGIVTDEYGEPLVGVQIKIKESSDSIFSDIDGKFKILAKETDSLIISYAGYSTLEMSTSKIIENKGVVIMIENEIKPLIPRETITCYMPIYIPVKPQHLYQMIR